MLNIVLSHLNSHTQHQYPTSSFQKFIIENPWLSFQIEQILSSVPLTEALLLLLTFAEHLKHCLRVDYFHFILVFKVKDQTFVMLSMGKSILTFFFFSSGFGPDLRIDRARASPNRPISTGSKTGTFATWKAQAWLELRLRCSDQIEMTLKKNKKEFDPHGQPEHHRDGWVVECCHQGEEGRGREEAVLHCTPRIWMLVYVWYSLEYSLEFGC